MPEFIPVTPLSAVVRMPMSSSEIRELFDSEPADGMLSCPVCGSKKTTPRPHCDCILTTGHHNNRNHHICWEENNAN